MANFQKLIAWAFENRDALELELTQFTETSEYLPNFQDWEASISVNNQRFVGRSVASFVGDAVGKAIVECIERATIGMHNVLGSGTAAHFDAQLAREYARTELIERDSVLVHFLSKRPFPEVPSDVSESIQRELRLGDKGSVHFFAARTALFGMHSIICLAKVVNRQTSEEKWIFGFGCSAVIHNAISKSLLECIQNFPVVAANKMSDFTDLASFNRKLNWIPKDHLFLGLDPHYVSQLRDQFHLVSHPEDYPFWHSVFLERLELTYNELPLPATLHDCGLVVVKCVSPLLQPYFVGPSNGRKLKLDRFSTSPEQTLYAKEKSAVVLSELPHFIG